MFIYLSKKISIPGGVKIRSIAWNTEQGWIAVGGENALLKVLKLDNGPNSTKTTGGNNLSMNQSLDGHEKAIGCVGWNDLYRKLTSSDENGLIIVWTLHKGMWCEEMVNTRNKSLVRDLSWNPNGERVAIVYEDGAVIVGSVEGTRLWGKEMKRTLHKITWSPDSRYLLLGTHTGDVNIHDSSTGQFITKVRVQCVEEGENKLAGLVWHPGSPEHCGEVVPSLAICYECGKCQIMRDESDDRPMLIDTVMKISTVRWNPQGTILAIGGTPSSAADKSVVVIQFYTAWGVHLRTLRVPGQHLGGLTWEGSGLRIALGIDSFIYFANVRPDYQWCYFNKTAVYAFSKPDRSERCVMFWSPKTAEKNIKYVRHLTHIAAGDDLCAIVSRADSDPGGPNTQHANGPATGQGQHMIALNNAVGSPVEVKYADLDPKCVCMNKTHVAVCSDENIWLWQYRNPNIDVDALDPVSIAASRKDSVERVFHVDDTVTTDTIFSTQITKRNMTQDLISSVTMSENLLLVARESGAVQIYSLSKAATPVLLAKQTLAARANHIAVNCNETRFSVIDIGGALNLYKIIPDKFSILLSSAEQIPFERKDIWQVLWSSDDPEMFAAMEKTRMYIFRGTDPDEPVVSSAHLCRFNGLKIKAVAIDDCVAEQDHPAKDNVLDHDTKSLRDTRQLLSTVGLKDAFDYVESHPHAKLWALIAEHALEKLDFTIAEKAVVRCREYPAIQFVKRVKALDDPQKQKAEVLAYYHRFDEAEKVFKEIDRRDLALELRARLGDWFRVIQFVQEGAGDESIMHVAWENIGDHYYDRQKWTKALQYYKHCNHHEKLAKVYYIQEDFQSLQKLVDQVSHNTQLLVNLGDMFLSVGLVEYAVAAFLKAGEVRMAVDSCIHLHHWDQAVAIAEKHQLKDIGHYLAKYASHLVEKGRVPQAIELFRKAGQNNEAAKLLSKLGQQAAQQQQYLKAKKFYVLAALEIETFRNRQVRLEQRNASEVADDLLAADKAMVGDKSLDSAWHGAEAYHFFLTCQLQLFNTQVDEALVTATRLMDYDDIIPSQDSYSLIALTAYYAKNFGVCSKAFTRLEALEAEAEAKAQMGSIGGGGLLALEQTDTAGTIDVGGATFVAEAAKGPESKQAGGNTLTTSLMSDQPRKFQELAVKIFTRNQPQDTSVDRVKCPRCFTLNKEWASHCKDCATPFAACIVTGRAMPVNTGWHCRTCRHSALEQEIQRFKNCPLCHAPVVARLVEQ